MPSDLIRRLFIEKKQGFDVEANAVLSDLKNNLGLSSLTSLRLANRYDICGLSDDEFSDARKTIFSEPNLDLIFDETWDIPDDMKVFAYEFLPGQFDQRADSASQCVQLLTEGKYPTVVTAKVIAINNDLNNEDFLRIQNYLINPVECRLASLKKPSVLGITSDIPKTVPTVDGFISMSEKKIKEYWGKLSFAMTADDLLFCQEYFKNTEKRNPTITELKAIDTYWSDHCRHTTFLTKLTDIKISEGKLSKAINDALNLYLNTRKELYASKEKDISLMDIATLGGKYLIKSGQAANIDISEEINACSIEVSVTIDEKKEIWLIQFKNETHNHPTEIEPFGGAATCLGGAIRDPLSGRSYVYQAMRVTGAGNPLVPLDKTLPGKLSQRKITTVAAAGYSSYGNQIGLATGQVTELYDPGYVAKRMEIGAVIGASPKANVIRKVPKSGDVVILLGGRTGRDGCGGATGSSKAHTEESIETCGAEVQKGNPPTERKIQRLFRNPDVSRLILRCNDFGAGGVCVAIGELADGLDIFLDKVPKKYEGLDGTELAISESQERMAVVVDKADAEQFISLANDENLEAVEVAVITDLGRLRMIWNDNTIVDLSREFLNTNGVTQKAEAHIECPDENNCYYLNPPMEVTNKSFKEAFLANLSRLEVAVQKGLAERFDASIGASTVIMPFGGKLQLTPEESMVAKIPLESGETDDATIMSYGFIPGISRFSPFHSSVFAVIECLSKILAGGADPLTSRLTFQEYFPRLRNDAKRWGQPVAALLGALSVQLALGVPSIGGKDSMSGSFNDLDVPPTLVSFGVAMTKASKTISAAFKSAKNAVLYIPVPIDNKTLIPNFNKLKNIYTSVYNAMQNGKILSASVVREGGLSAAISRMTLGNNIGFKFKTEEDFKTLFAPLAGSLVFEVNAENQSIFDKIGAVLIGKTINEKEIICNSNHISLAEVKNAMYNTLEPVFPNNAPDAPAFLFDVPLFNKRSVASPIIKTAKPKVFIPAFPGTNCEIDSARAFIRAGGDPQVLIVKNLTPSDITDTIENMVNLINNSQIIMIPGGFSGGDEPDGSGKFIATTFRNPRISEAVNNLLYKRDGLILGICNGFQALIKLGLLPFGKIKSIGPDDPTLTFNSINRHVSRMVYTRITSVNSPWLSKVNTGDIHCVPVSHGEGRFVANDDVIKKLIKNGQIATQYVDLNGIPSQTTEWNPNASYYSIEGVFSPDGRILGKMGHSERQSQDAYLNIPGSKNQYIFESGIEYFK